MFPLSLTANQSLITRAIGDSHSFPLPSLSLAGGSTAEGDSAQKTSLYILNPR